MQGSSSNHDHEPIPTIDPMDEFIQTFDLNWEIPINQVRKHDVYKHWLQDRQTVGELSNLIRILSHGQRQIQQDQTSGRVSAGFYTCFGWLGFSSPAEKAIKKARDGLDDAKKNHGQTDSQALLPGFTAGKVEADIGTAIKKTVYDQGGSRRFLQILHKKKAIVTDASTDLEAQVDDTQKKKQNKDKRRMITALMRLLVVRRNGLHNRRIQQQFGPIEPERCWNELEADIDLALSTRRNSESGELDPADVPSKNDLFEMVDVAKKLEKANVEAVLAKLQEAADAASEDESASPSHHQLVLAASDIRNLQLAFGVHIRK